METDDRHDDLTALFAQEDDALAPEDFVQSVMKPIRNRARWRQALLFGAGGLGLGAAVSQLASLVGDWHPEPMGSETASSFVRAQLDGLSAVDPTWLIVIGMAAICVALMAVFERA